MDSLKVTGHGGLKSSEPGPPPRSCRLQLSHKTLFTNLFIIAPLLAVASAVELALAAEGTKRGPSGWIGSKFFTEPENFSETLSEYPMNIFVSQGTLKMASASLSLICAVALAGVAWHTSVKGPIRTLYFVRIALLVVLGVNAVLSLATFLYAFVAHTLSAHFDAVYAMELTQLPSYRVYDRGTFDLETWACETKDLPNYDSVPAGKLHTLCVVEMGARWMTLFVFLLASSLFIVVYLDRRGGKHLVTTWKNRRASWREDYY